MAKPFRLTTLLKLREGARDERRVALGEAFRADAVLAEQLAEVDRELAEMAEDYRQASQAGRINVDRLIHFHRHDSVLRAVRTEQVRRRETLAVEIERRRQALVAADRDVKTIEKLRERHNQRETARAQTFEAKQLDEFVITQSDRSSASERGEAAWAG